jgi:hypothetical protein
MAWSNIGDLRLSFCPTKKIFYLATLRSWNQGDYNTFLASTAGTAGAVKVSLVFLWWVNLDNQGNIINVDSTSCNVGRYQYANSTLNKAL